MQYLCPYAKHREMEEKMIRILLACAGGMSTSLLMNKMKDEADKRGIEISVDAIPEKSIEAHLGQFDVLLLGPQVRYVLKMPRML